MPRRLHVTGDIDIHELAYDQHHELWVVNTRFCCLCTLDADHSFAPRWRPPFVSALAPEDRCHLNGLGMVDGRPKYVTALGTTDTPGGWRANKASGGILMDLDTNEIVLRGLSMPHSPRWYQGQLWFLESGQGSLARADLPAGALGDGGPGAGVHPGPRLLWAAGLYRALAGAGERRLQRHSAGASGSRSAPAGCGWCTWRRARPWAFCALRRACRRSLPCRCCPASAFPRCWSGAMRGWRTPMCCRMPPWRRWRGRPRRSWPAPRPCTSSAARRCTARASSTEAIAAYRQCVALDPTFPHARYHLGVALGDAEHYDEAVAWLQQVLAAEPEHAEAYNSLGYCYSRLGQPAQAVAAFERAIALQPDYAQAHVNLGMTLLQLGDYPRGFAEYEWRWQTGQFTPFQCPHPRWDGRPIPDQTLLIHTEQGAGDAIQFARYLPLAAQRCGTTHPGLPGRPDAPVGHAAGRGPDPRRRDHHRRRV